MTKWVKTKADELALSNGCYFDEKAANHARTFIESYLCITPGTPFKLLDWQWLDVVAPLFGWKRKDGSRRFRKAYVEIPKKNGKSLLCSAIALYLLMADGEWAAEIYCAAFNREQAGIIYKEARKLVDASKDISPLLDCIDTTKYIKFDKTRSFIKALSRDSKSSEGLNIHGLIFDEVHTQQTRELWDALLYGGASRKQPLTVAITTAGYDKESICWELHEKAQKVIEGIEPDDTFLAVIYAASATDPIDQETTWRKANPSYGITLNEIDFANEARQAKENPRQENAFRRYRLNQWTESETRLISQDRWDNCRQDFTPESLKGQPCYIGIDLSVTTDVTAAVGIFPFDDGSYKLLPYFWLPTEKIKEMRNRVAYDVWAKQGHLIPIVGDVIDYDQVRADILRLFGSFNIRGFAIDPYNSQNIESQLIAKGFKVWKCRQQAIDISPPTKEFDRLIVTGKMNHNNNPVLNWMVSCTTAREDENGNLKPVKPDRHHSTNKIDGVVASIMGLALALNTANELGRLTTKSCYEERGLLTIG